VTRKLILKSDRLTELTSDELAAVVGAQQILSRLVCVTDQLTICDAERCAR
jgi:hypothetical protein